MSEQTKLPEVLSINWNHKDQLIDVPKDRLISKCASPELAAEMARRWNAHEKLVKALKAINEYPVHSEPIVCANSMQDIAAEALNSKV